MRDLDQAEARLTAAMDAMEDALASVIRHERAFLDVASARRCEQIMSAKRRNGPGIRARFDELAAVIVEHYENEGVTHAAVH